MNRNWSTDDHPIEFTGDTRRSAVKQDMRRGVSLLELTVVALVLGIVAAVGTHGYADALARHRAQRTAQRVAADIDHARHVSRCRGVATSITFTSAQYTIAGIPNPDRPAAAYVVSLNDGALRASASDINFGGDAVLAFNAFGTPDSGGSLRVTSGIWSFTVTVAASGAVSLP